MSGSTCKTSFNHEREQGTVIIYNKNGSHINIANSDVASVLGFLVSAHKVPDTAPLCCDHTPWHRHHN